MNSLIEDPKKLLRSYITAPDVCLKQSDLKILHRTPNENRLLNVTKCPASTTLKPKRDYLTGEIVDFAETFISHADANAKNSTSFKRAPAPEESIRGNPLNFPFWPGGFDEPDADLETFYAENIGFDDEPRLTIPPDFDKGYSFESEVSAKIETGHMVNLLTVLEKDLELSEWLDSSENDYKVEKDKNKEPVIFNTAQSDDSLFEAFEPVPILQISQCSSEVQFSSQWAEIIDTRMPVVDFEKKVPEPATEFPFELDNFQKQAIIKVEEQEYVFVAAHTSAGKTVIAEYAIALCMKHKTKVCYTSPVKALSNQKYRDFGKFKDIGLVTGDRQIDNDACCVIMTTEILRSMLFGGSDFIRDLEYVIFDEVHYINDPDRGHVWEEVIMLLPKNVNIIMLSATVPNVIELAEWVGMIKGRKVYVIMTMQRPVPLEHYLYVDSGGKKKENMHLIVDSKNQFLVKTFNEVKAELDEKNSKKMKSGPPNNPKEEQRKWSSLIDFLQKKNKLPVIAFTLSRNRCDSNARALSAKDLNTAREKASVHTFFQQCISKLKPEDRVLNQVMLIKESLERGIGIHHSGILPILKEIVELAFQNGWVKVLFATETFAMGVNMPARSVVFDSYKKHDGTELRSLKPSEYTQMAGRAGRRGHDDTGTVILFCKQNLPLESELKHMIQGRADLLLSKFRLRYAAILKCLCVEGIQIENLMKHSFKEFKSKKEAPAISKLLEETKEELSKVQNLDKGLEPLENFFNISYKFLTVKQNLMEKILELPNYFKEVKFGRVIILSFESHYNKLGIILNVKYTGKIKSTTLKVLVLDNKNPETLKSNESELWHNMVSLTKEMQFFRPVGADGHIIIEIMFRHIVELTKINIKIEPDLIIKNWEQRQIERFKDSPPSQSVQKAVFELNQLNENYISKPDSLQMINLKKELSLNIDQANEISDLWKSFIKEKENLDLILPYTNIANFQEEFKVVFKKKMLEKQYEALKFQNSPKSLSLYSDYQDKLNVLKELGFVDENEVVPLKGKIACQMGQNELFIMELLYSNTFENLDEAEIAALLSGLVFQAKTNTDFKIPEKIKKAKERFEKIYHDIELTEQKYNLHPGLENRLNFGLIEVVYEWARNKPFSQITELTDIQEGIIVRCIQQLDETIQDVRTAAIQLTNVSLQKKMEEASSAIKRDIVFAGSLYTNSV